MTHHAARIFPTARRKAPRPFLPAMGKDWLLPLYDPFTRLLGMRRLHAELAQRAGLAPGQRVLEIGCGTGNLALLVKRRQPGAEVVALDPDPAALARAARKTARAGLSVQLDEGFAGSLPYADDSFDRVLSAFMFHHLDDGEKRAALREVGRVLRPDGSLHLLDFGGAVAHEEGRVARLLHHSPRLKDNLGDGIPALMREAGLGDPAESGHRVTRIGRSTFYRAGAPGAGH